MTANTPQDYLNFLMETFQKISENPNPQVIYNFWEQNLDKLDDNLLQILDDWAKNTLSSVKVEEAENIARVIVYFSDLIEKFPLGNIAINKEIAITGYEIALNEFTFDRFPIDWAMTQTILAIAYSQRIRGDKAENLEKTIAYCREALKVFTFDAFPQEWAMTQNIIALAYPERIRGDKAENLEKTIAAYQETLKVFTFETFPQLWAMKQKYLAIAYSKRIRGDKAENLEIAMTCYENALKGYESGGNSLEAAEMALILGKIYVEQGHWYKGLDYLEKSWQKYRLLDNFKGLADVTYQIGHTHHLIGNFEKASVNYRDALRFYEYLKDDRGVAFCKASLGRLILQFAPVEEAEKYLEEAQKIFIDINEQSQVNEIENILQYLKQIKEKQDEWAQEQLHQMGLLSTKALRKRKVKSKIGLSIAGAEFEEETLTINKLQFPSLSFEDLLKRALKKYKRVVIAIDDLDKQDPAIVRQLLLDDQGLLKSGAWFILTGHPFGLTRELLISERG